MRTITKLKTFFKPMYCEKYYMDVDNGWVTAISPENNIRVLVKDYQYLHVLKRNRGKYQRGVATVRRIKERHHYWWRWPKTTYSLEASFNRHMGPLANSWRGGITFVTFKLRKNETMDQGIKRMESEYTFK